mgnify:CR=1 FL=1
MWKNGMRPVFIGRMPFFVLCLGPYNNVELRRRRRRRQHTYSGLQIPPYLLYLLYNGQEG